MELPADSPAWVADLDRQLLRNRHALLFGNVTDLYRWGTETLPLSGVLYAYLRTAGYQVVLTYDSVDGIRLADESMAAAYAQARGGTAPPPSISATPPPAPTMGLSRSVNSPTSFGSSGSGGVSPPGARPVPAPQPVLPTPEASLPVLRTVLSQSAVAVAVVIGFADKLVASAQNLSPSEVNLVLLLKKLTQEAATIATGPAAQRRNAVLLVGEQLGGVPGWVYQDNPQVALVKVPRPNPRERRATLDAQLTPQALAGVPEAERKSALDALALLTDGLTTHDLFALRRTAVRETQFPATDPKRLADYFKYGVKDDPWAVLNAERVRDAPGTLGKRVIGQPLAIDALIGMLKTARTGLKLRADGSKAGRPKGVFFFVGPTGVGKTELAKGLSELIFGDTDESLQRFDMSEYAMEHAAEKLTGSPPGYVGYEEGGLLTGRVLDKPFSLLLFDEIEKAHGKIMDKFLQILEDGRLTDSRGQTADFSQSVIIFTSNIGSASLGWDGTRPPDAEAVQEHYLAAVRQHFTDKLGRPELLNRLGDNVVVFDLLREDHIPAIAGKMLADIAASAKQELGLELTFDPSVADAVRRQMVDDPANLRMGGRRVLSLIEAQVYRPLGVMLFDTPRRGGRATVRMGESGLVVS